jgi:hypothetical protein
MTARRIDRALEHFRAGERDLYTEEGQKLYSDEEHERRMNALLEEFDREKDGEVAEVDRTIEKAERTLALEHRDLSDSLTNTELERANAKRSYVEDDVWNLSLEDLVRSPDAHEASKGFPVRAARGHLRVRCSAMKEDDTRVFVRRTNGYVRSWKPRGPRVSGAGCSAGRQL